MYQEDTLRNLSLQLTLGNSSFDPNPSPIKYIIHFVVQSIRDLTQFKAI